MVNSRFLVLKFELLYLITLFLLSFVNGLIAEFAYIFVFGSVLLALVDSKSILAPKGLQIFTGFVLIWSFLQYAILGAFAWKWVLNFCGFMVGIASVATIVSKLSKEALFQFDFYLRSIIFILGTAYALFPVIEYGFTGTFFIDGNYLYASAGRFIANGLVEKQMMSAFLLLYVIVCAGLIKKHLIAMPALIALILAINMLLASRSQMIGILVALFLIVITRGGRFIKTSAIITSAFSFLAVFLMHLDVFTEFHNVDIRVMIFHAAAITFFSNLFFGVGIYNLPQFLGANNQAYLSNFGNLYPNGWGSLASFPTGFESSFFQFAVEMGVIWFFVLYLAIKFLLINYHNIEARFKYLALFGLIYFFSAFTEDNLTQPPTYILVAIYIGIYARRHRKYFNSLRTCSRVTSPLIGGAE